MLRLQIRRCDELRLTKPWSVAHFTKRNHTISTRPQVKHYTDLAKSWRARQWMAGKSSAKQNKLNKKRVVKTSTHTKAGESRPEAEGCGWVWLDALIVSVSLWESAVEIAGESSGRWAFFGLGPPLWSSYKEKTLHACS